MEKRTRRVHTGVYQKTNLDFGKIYQRFTSNLSPNTGSVTSFLGVARLESADGKKKINSLVIESYEKHANQILNRIAEETKRKFSLTDILIVHGLGRFYPGQPVVMVIVASSRRSEAFSALREAVERYKKEPALFKKEIYAGGTSAWIS